jgi:hypothetical protein
MFNAIVGAGNIGAGSASRYGSGSVKMMGLLVDPAPQYWGTHIKDNFAIAVYGAYKTTVLTFEFHV